uniref:Uncharacterized protein n=1 Tax=Oryza rufipogon TaxID=4529 RepID=A0A0E0MWA5_ORYRU
MLSNGGVGLLPLARRRVAAARLLPWVDSMTSGGGDCCSRRWIRRRRWRMCGSVGFSHSGSG